MIAMARALRIDEVDNVATLLSQASSGEIVEIVSGGGSIIDRVEALESIPFGHKIALIDIGEGEEIIKYGEVIGVASKPIRRGEWVHTHNVESVRLPERRV